MGFEFQACVDHQFDLGELQTGLERSGEYRAIKKSRNMVSLAHASKPPRPDWPEDFELSLSEGNLHLLIHGGTANQREALLRN